MRVWLTCVLLTVSAPFLAPAPAVAAPMRVWTDLLLEAIRPSPLGPSQTARAIAVAYTCGFDAWAAYDDRAVPTSADPSSRRPLEERTSGNKEMAFAHGFYRALLDLFPDQAATLRERFAAAGYDPDDFSVDPTTPSGIGNTCAAAILAMRHADGSNQLGDLHAGAYSDYTGYVPMNSLDQIVDPNRWQPLRFTTPTGVTAPGFSTPQWHLVVPFALESADQFRPPAPVLYPAGGYVAQVREILHHNAHLDDRMKAAVEYWMDGPRTERPPGHWLLFANFVSARDGNTFDEDVHLFFPLANAMLDASIASWDAKRHYDYIRPISAVRFLYSGKKVRAYVPFEGPRIIDGAAWTPYQPASFLTPPFPEYVSGHSTFSAAAAEILRLATGSDAFGASVTIAPGTSKVEPGVAPSAPVTLSWATFGEAADEAGLSRRWGGIHFEDGDLQGRALGRKVAAVVWERAQRHLRGPVSPAAHARRFERRAASVAATSRLSLAATPNPGPRGTIAIRFSLPEAAAATVRVHDVRGRMLTELASGTFDAGTHSLPWRGAPAAGLYFVQLEALGEKHVQRVVVLD